MCSSIHPIISTLLQDLKLTKHWFSSFHWAPLQEGMNEICATFRPPITIFLMAGALTISYVQLNVLYGVNAYLRFLITIIIVFSAHKYFIDFLKKMWHVTYQNNP